MGPDATIPLTYSGRLRYTWVAVIGSPFTTLGLVLPTHPYPLSTYPGFIFPWNLKYSGLFAKFGDNTISLFTPSDPHGVLYTCEVPFIAWICSVAAREAWSKPIEEYRLLSYFGGNVIIAEGEGWRHQIPSILRGNVRPSLGGHA